MTIDLVMSFTHDVINSFRQLMFCFVPFSLMYSTSPPTNPVVCQPNTVEVSQAKSILLILNSSLT